VRDAQKGWQRFADPELRPIATPNVSSGYKEVPCSVVRMIEATRPVADVSPQRHTEDTWEKLPRAKHHRG